jgi:ABC-2 type transport system permease protein
MSAPRSVSVALGMAARGTRRLQKNPPQALPPMLIPLFFFAAFTGALSALGSSKGFGYYNYTAFQFIFVLYMGAMFVGVFSAFDIARDYENGFGQRLMLAAPRRMALITGYVIVSFGRGLLVIGVVWGVALATGMPVRGDAIDVAAIIALALLLNLATALWGAGIALRFQTTASGVLILIPTFMALFMTPVFEPRHRLSGWLRTAADINPLTAPMEAGRGFLAHDRVSVGLGFAVAAGLVLLMMLWATRGMHKAERGPGGTPPRRPRGGPRARRGA